LKFFLSQTIDRVVAKKDFLDDKKKKNQQGLSGRDWYNQEATRAFNQVFLK